MHLFLILQSVATLRSYISSLQLLLKFKNKSIFRTSKIAPHSFSRERLLVLTIHISRIKLDFFFRGSPGQVNLSWILTSTEIPSNPFDVLDLSFINCQVTVNGFLL